MCTKQHTYAATLSLAPSLLQSLLGIHRFLPAFHAKHHVEILLRISIHNFHVHLRDFHLFISNPPVGPAEPSLDSTEYRIPSSAEPDVLREFEAFLESSYDPEVCLLTATESRVCREPPYVPDDCREPLYEPEVCWESPYVPEVCSESPYEPDVCRESP